MRVIIFKIIAFMALFIYLQGVCLPWIVSNNFMPLWADVVLFTLILVMWIAGIDRLAKIIVNKMDEEKED